VLIVCGVSEAMSLAGRVTAGVRVNDPGPVAGRLAADPEIGEDDLVLVVWEAALDGRPLGDSADQIRGAGGVPWVHVVFTTPAPLIENIGGLELELARLAAMAGSVDGEVFIQVEWRPETGSLTAADLAYLIKRAAVVVTGAASRAEFAVGPLPADPAFLEWLYVEEVAAYVDVPVLAPTDEAVAAIEALATLDPGKPVAVDAVMWSEAAVFPVAEIAAWAASGASITIIDARSIDTVDPGPLKIAAGELSGELVHDPAADPESAGEAWAFVREDLDLRVVATRAPGERRLRLVFDDRFLRSPELVDAVSGEVRAVTGVARDGGFVVVVNDAPEVALLRLQRPSIDEIDGFDEEIEIAGGRQMPVEEILRRLQAFEDDQARRLEHYQATRTMNLRFQGRQGSIDATYAGEVFFRGESFDWVWSEFFIAGVKWRSRKMPKVPLIQPEKVGSLPVEIRMEKDYEYRLRGADEIDGRDCWIVDFKPVDVPPGASRFQGTVWVDREIYARVRTRAVQVGLEGDVLSNEEIYHFSPVDEAGQPAPWATSSFVLPLTISGQQVFSILNATVPVEVENRLTDIRINGPDWDANRQVALDSDATMLRDTDQGLRYLEAGADGERVVETEFDSSRLFLAGGVLWDESFDYPIPAVGVDYIDLDFKDTGAQLNLLFAGVYTAANISDPDLFGSRWNAGASLNGLFIKTNDELYRDGEVVPEETIRRRTGSLNAFIGRPLGSFLSLELAYRLRHEDFDDADDTADGFILPQDTFTHGIEASVDFNRAGFRLAVGGGTYSRSDWEYWGLPGNSEYTDDQKEYQRWQVTFAKTWWFERFHKIGVSIEHLDSRNTDRFSGYDFGLFGDSTVAGYPTGLVRAEEVNGAHLSGGINVMELIRLNVGIDAVWASNQATGLDNELLAGIGAGGTLTLPWQLLLNFDVGYAIAGPGEGSFAVRAFVLKLFPKS
jgi:hypothetical protein